MNDELQRCLSSQNKQGFLSEMENRIKQISSEKITDAAKHNSDVDALMVILQQGQNLLPRFTFQLYVHQLENSKVKIAVAKPVFKFSRKATQQKQQNTTTIDNDIINDIQTWQMKGEKNVSKEVSSDETRVGLTELENCTVKIVGSPMACCFTNLKDTTVIALNIGGSIHITKCTNCKFLLGCKQLRIHETYDTDFYVEMMSGPIIEDCDRVRFAPYGSQPGPWNDVKDFKWLKSEKSPHWTTIPENEQSVPQYVTKA
ncbi:tubulin folding cofactor C, putative [Trichomonas vaginalis G3]|uniref:Tubulin folding cofactor C, putative n=1 Tax=Trichomonas vaginalis (strain ATCC PRA-98 / G3) TaxID=412133 RepID=A2FN58_TRIV3|nr:post-chaperonin tubulin folding pathway [Trichomonas vaginalis G3]EAX93658.1 tubulin folding cofactor C, putative [Trichomonas vaginalis G3]KAI5522844.1 post-chaperonin tubulin folding pathway [Trichomonas vaginalis G3]|eukprot:XP_001306588.1 tubulin folding cofactor C [Trichomonas vaginalis G3]